MINPRFYHKTLSFQLRKWRTAMSSSSSSLASFSSLNSNSYNSNNIYKTKNGIVQHKNIFLNGDSKHISSTACIASSSAPNEQSNHSISPVEWSMYHNTTLHQQPNSDDRLLEVKDRESYYGCKPRTSILMELTDRVGILHDVLRYFWKYDINITRIESRPMKKDQQQEQSNRKFDGNTSDNRYFDFFIDFDGSVSDANVSKLLETLNSEKENDINKLLVLDEKEVHWFPRHISELDLVANRTLDAGVDLQSDHPGFHDKEYRDRRARLTKAAQDHRWNIPIQKINYTKNEIATWGVVWDRMEPLWEKYACKEYLNSLELLKEHCNYSRDNIPQQHDINSFLYSRTQFNMRPVAGLLSSRDFLNGLAFRVFFSTQYIRHHSKPLYTPEPDICHEFLGHIPMFVDKDFADFSQEIGLASLGASDDDINKLAHCYWHSVEFGLCKEEEINKKTGDSTIVNKAYGAGLLSSFGELEYACGDGSNSIEDDSNHDDKNKQMLPEIKPWDPEVASHQEFPITTYQPTYFLADSLQDAKQKMRKYCEDLQRPFFALYNKQNDTIHIDRPVKRTRGLPF